MVSGKILGLLATFLYVLVTLTPDRDWQGLILTPHLIAWPFVVIWQLGLLSMVILLLLRFWPQKQPFYLLGQGFDRLCLFLIGAVTISTIFGQFRNQAVWQCGVLAALIAIVYALFQELKLHRNLMGLLRFQGVLQIAFIVESLVLWISQTLLPELDRINAFNNLEIPSSFDFSQIQLRNGIPLGHQNYVAGYLVLALGLLIGMAFTDKGLWRRIWWVGIALGTIDLYTTSSRGGWLGLVVLLVGGFTILLLRCRGVIPLSRIFIGGLAVFLACGGFVLFNNRLRSLFSASRSGEFFYRWLTSNVGWAIGKAHFLVGAAPGATPMLYQKFRPAWAGREAEMVYQLHSTPVQIWAELGLMGVLWSILAVLLGYRFWDRLHRSPWQENQELQGVTYGITLALLGYGAVALTDYQLDVLPIALTIGIYLAALAYVGTLYFPETTMATRLRKPIALFGWGVTIAALVWLTPVDMAWQQSELGFRALESYRSERNNMAVADQYFQNFQEYLQRSTQLAPWESYYAYQLGWNLGIRGWYEPSQQRGQAWQKEGVAWLEKGNIANPYQEFGYHNAAWLYYNLGNHGAAQRSFQKGLELVPGKRSLSFGLGLSILSQGKSKEGLTAIATECFNSPLFVTSPLWGSQQLRGIYSPMLAILEQLYQNSTDRQAKLVRASLHWWTGKPNAIQELRSAGFPQASLLSAALEDNRAQLQQAIDQPNNAMEMVIAAWYNPSQRRVLLEKAWITANKRLIDSNSQRVLEAILNRMNSSKSFDQFLREPLPLFTVLNLKNLRQRLGFGVLSRHVDGPNPYDLFVIDQHGIIATFFASLFPEPSKLLAIK